MTLASKNSLLIYVSALLVSVMLMVYGYASVLKIPKQVGALGLLVTVLYAPLLFVGEGVRANILKLFMGFAVFTSIFFITGEVALRLFYWEGETFSAHVGPVVKRFEKDFQFNRFDGPSRGPETSDENSANRSLRLLVQGDSITWGQGVKEGKNLYTTRLLTTIRKTVADADMAVLAVPGREIDDHVKQLRKWGQKLKPDVVIYQWYINDMDIQLVKSDGQKINLPWWKRLFFYQFLAEHSYLWFFLEYNINRLLPSTSQPYTTYLSEKFSTDSVGWNKFSGLFNEWCGLAKELTPRVLVVLYPHMLSPQGAPPTLTPEIQGFHNRVSKLCSKDGLVFLDLTTSFTSFKDSREIWASRFDAHPSAAAHAVMSEEIVGTLRELWPAIFSSD